MSESSIMIESPLTRSPGINLIGGTQKLLVKNEYQNPADKVTS
jgi:hypothetical protein